MGFAGPQSPPPPRPLTVMLKVPAIISGDKVVTAAPGPGRDLYASLAEPASQDADNAGAWTLRILYEPLVNFIWLGSVMLVLGGGLSLSDRRLRVGAPRRAAPAPMHATPAE